MRTRLNQNVLPSTRYVKFQGELMNPEEGILSAAVTSFGNEDTYGDVIVKGSLDKWIQQEGQCMALWSHDRAEIIGKWDKFSICP